MVRKNVERTKRLSVSASGEFEDPLADCRNGPESGWCGEFRELTLLVLNILNLTVYCEFDSVGARCS